jgi:hypothetical protein
MPVFLFYTHGYDSSGILVQAESEAEAKAKLYDSDCGITKPTFRGEVSDVVSREGEDGILNIGRLRS